MGLSIVAACLPTLRPLFSDIAPDAWPSMLKSWLSLGSIFSRASSRGRSQNNHKDFDNISNSSYRGFVPKAKHGKVATEIYPMADVEAQSPVPASRIMVQNKITQTSWTH